MQDCQGESAQNPRWALGSDEGLSATVQRLFAFCSPGNGVDEDQGTGVILTAMRGRKDPAAVSLGRKGGKASAKKLAPQQRREKARKAPQARWAKHKKVKM
jgi:hypothetical protein